MIQFQVCPSCPLVTNHQLFWVEKIDRVVFQCPQLEVSSWYGTIPHTPRLCLLLQLTHLEEIVDRFFFLSQTYSVLFGLLKSVECILFCFIFSLCMFSYLIYNLWNLHTSLLSLSTVQSCLLTVRMMLETFWYICHFFLT